MNQSYVFAGISILVWSTIASVTKLLLHDLSNYLVLFVSCFFSVLALLIMNIITGDIKTIFKLKLRDFLKISAIGSFGAFFYQVFYYAGAKRMPASQAFIINYLWPIMGVIFACIILKEKMTVRKCIAVIMSFLGVVIVTLKELIVFDKTIIIGALLCALGAVFYGLFTATSQKLNYDKKVSAMIYYFFSFILSGIFVAISGDSLNISSTNLLGLAYNGVFCFAVGTTCWTLAVKRGKTARIANLAYITPFLSLIWISIFFDDEKPFNPNYFIGLCVIVMGILIQLEIPDKLFLLIKKRFVKSKS